LTSNGYIMAAAPDRVDLMGTKEEHYRRSRDARMLPATNVAPSFNVTRASHLVLTSRDLAKARDFYTEVIGLKVSHETATTIHFRGGEERVHHSLTLRATKGQPACERIGLRMFWDDDLERAKAAFDAKGFRPKFVNVPFQGRTLHVNDAGGTPLEFCARMKSLPRAHAGTHEDRGASALRISHFQVLLPDVTAAVAFYCDLGFRVADYSCIGQQAVGALLHRKSDPHDIVVQEGAGPRLHHVGFIVQETHHIMRAIDVAGQLRLGQAPEYGPGRHGHSYRVYLRDPDGHRIALLRPPIQVIDADDGPVRHDVDGGDKTMSASPPRSWFDEASAFAGVRVRDAAVRATKGLFGEGAGFREADAAYRAGVASAHQNDHLGSAA
jgi:catechol 2,3-dioxygenase